MGLVKRLLSYYAIKKIRSNLNSGTNNVSYTAVLRRISVNLPTVEFPSVAP